MYASANATHTSRHNRGTSGSGPGPAGFPDHSAQGQKCVWPCPRIAAPGHRSALTGTPYHNAQSKAAWREGSGLPRPSQTDHSSPGQQDRPRAIYTYPPEPPEFNRPPCLGCWETCTKDSGPPHPHLSGVPVRRGPYLCLKRDTVPTTECALRPSGGEGAKPNKQSSGLPRPVRIPGPNGAHPGMDIYTTTAYAIALTPAHSHQCRDTHAVVVVPPPPWYSRGIPANAGKSPCLCILIRAWLKGTIPRPYTSSRQRQRHAHEQVQPGQLREQPGPSGLLRPDHRMARGRAHASPRPNIAQRSLARRSRTHRAGREQSQGHIHLHTSANATHTSRCNRGNSGSSPDPAGFCAPTTGWRAAVLMHRRAQTSLSAHWHAAPERTEQGGNNPRAIYICTPAPTPRTRARATGATQGAARTQRASAPRPQDCARLCSCIAVPKHRSALTGTPLQNAQSKAVGSQTHLGAHTVGHASGSHAHAAAPGFHTLAQLQQVRHRPSGRRQRQRSRRARAEKVRPH